MECPDFTVLLCLLMAVGTTMVFAEKRQGLNGHCIHISECKQLGYFCHRNKTCQCGPGYTPDEKWKACIGFIGSRCMYDNQCIEGSYCTGLEGRETCRCREADDLYPSEDNKSCISSAWTIYQAPSTVLALLTIFWTSLYLNT